MKLSLFALLTLCALLIFALTMTFVPILPLWVNYASRAAFLIVFGALWWLAARRDHLSRFRPVIFAYFTAALSVSIAYFFAGWVLKLSGLGTQTPPGVALAKFSEALLIVSTIVAATRLNGDNLGSIFIRQGRLALGLTLGLIGAAVCLLLALQQPVVQALETTRLLSLVPWIAVFVLCNGFMEELLYRGLFLGRYAPLIGNGLATVSTALAFTLAHMQVKYTTDLVGFLVVLLVLSILWGWLIVKTRSLWGSALFHAGADLLIILPIFTQLGAA